jgi:hypothetical protein
VSFVLEAPPLAFETDSVSLLNTLILVISAHHHSSKDGLAFPLASATSEEEGQGSEGCTHDCGDGRLGLVILALLLK